MNIIKKMAEIGPFRKPTFMYSYPSYLSREDATRWLKKLLDGSVAGLEVFLNEKEVKIQLVNTIPSFSSAHEQKEPLLLTDSPLSQITDIESFEFYLKKPSIYSITQDNMGSWLNSVESINGEAWIQVLFQKERNAKWKGLLRQQYDDYLKGISYPSMLAPVRSLQLKIAEISHNITITIPTIPSFEERKNQTVYRFLIRGYVRGEEIDRKIFIEDLLESLNRQCKENEWGVSCKKEVNKERIEKWSSLKAPYLRHIHPFIVESELVSLLPCTSKIKTTQVIQQDKRVTNKANIIPIFQFLPFNTLQQEPLLLDHFEQELNGSLEKLGVIKEEGLKIIGFEQGPTLIRLNIMLPKGIRLSDLQKAIIDWQTELGITDLLVLQGKEKGSGTLTLPRKNRQAVYLRNLVDTKEFKDFSKDKVLPFVVGATETGEPYYDDITRVKHLLVAGTTGSGKSIWLLQFILTLLIWVPPEQLMMYLIDPKRVEFPGFSKFKNVKVYTEVEEAKQLLVKLIDLMEKRYELFGKEGVRNIAQYNRKVKDAPIPYVIAVIDEFSDFLMQDKENGTVEDSIIRLAQKARACGIHLIITTQRPSVDVVTGLIKANLPSRVVFKCSGRNDYSTVLDQKPSFNLLGNGDGACLLEGKVLTRFQGPLIAGTEEEMDSIIETYGKSQSGSAPLLLDIHSQSNEVNTSVPLDELKRYIAFTGETRITHLRKHMKMRMNDVKDLMQVLVEEGWLEAPKNRNSGYKLIISDQERESFLSANSKEDEK
ncbi:FtsK/SpoIIIE domain-containing protein [Niallia oryzisoli]|uniref:FtsK/SpoIIIE domain-containing protein n=1 Tax=Niallia oryzisoli TaxID=1737571 RepID=UPI003734C964